MENRQHRQQILYRGETYVVCAERTAMSIRVWVERGVPDSSYWTTLADGQATVPDGPDQRNEFAISRDAFSELAEEITIATGLFRRTGRSYTWSGRVSPIWSLSPSSPLRIRSIGEPDARALHDPLGLQSSDINATVSRLVSLLGEFGAIGIVVTGPDVTDVDPERRELTFAAPTDLWQLNPQLFACDRRRLHPASEWGRLEDAQYVGSSTLHGLGYEAWVSVRIPLADGHYYEIVMLGMRSLGDAPQACMAAATALNLIVPLRRAAAEKLKLSARELDVLRIGSLGVIETAEILGLSVATVKFHRDKIRRKIGNEPTWQQAYVRAQKVGVLD